MRSLMSCYHFPWLLLLAHTSQALLHASETPQRLTLSNDRLTASVNKSTGAIDALSLDGQDLLGTPSSSNPAVGPYLDCYCIPGGNGAYTPGSMDARYQLLTASDNPSWVGIVMSEIYPPTGQLFEQYWFLRDEETGLHTFSRLAYHNSSTRFVRNLSEFRTLFRPNTRLWTHLSTNEKTFAPLPDHNPATGDLEDAVKVQDATWYLRNRSDPYVQGMSDYFTKYTFSDSWRDHRVHGLFGSNGTTAATFGAWFVMNTRDTYFGGPLHSDLTVDGFVYNYLVSTHHGDQTPNITDGFDRTFGPGYYYFNSGPGDASLQALRSDALRYADPDWSRDFYDEIAEFVPGYVPSSGRGSWRGKIELPQGSTRPVAVLSQSGVDFQDNVANTSAYQYWADIDTTTGSVSISHAKPGLYRLTVYADGIFGQYEQDDILISAGQETTTVAAWREEAAGQEIWRIGTPDKSSGEYRHGDQLDPTHPLHPEEYRIYWAIYDYVDDFPEGVRFEIGKSDEVRDWNYVHWSVFGGSGNSIRRQPHYGDGNVNNWTILFDVSGDQLQRKREATFTVQLAGAKTAAGNTDTFNASQLYSDLPYTVVVNGHALEPWIIPYYQSSSCAVRSAVSCYNLAHKFVFDASLLTVGKNALVLRLPFNGTDYESAILSPSVYVQYDALRLEVR
ncbi:polysaccharide lyase family 4 [Lecanosticta acicola]|uniref:rhamnogalacturonan endolyase n=1 Tax=Lecanosticta acicola TaxID=111012 RepID=A0AAI9EAW6_9PEZI|nr:polysaccharide lyase family 4 [Lecanosticta acicola]